MATHSPQETRILVVDDEESVLKLTSHVLEMQGYQVISAPHSEAALHLAREFPGKIHLLLTDVRMDPHMSGCLLAQQLRPGRSDMKILYMSGFPASEIVQKEVEQGNASLLKKPFTPTVLLGKVNSVLGA